MARLARAPPIGSKATAPVISLSVEVVEIGEAARGEKGAAHVADGAFDPALLVAAGHRDRPRLEAILPGEGEQAGMEADRVVAPFQHRTLEIGAGRPGPQRCVGSSSRPGAADHRLAVRVNRDASLSVAAPASGPSGRHASDGHDGLPGSVVRPAGSSVAEPAERTPQRSRSGRGRSNCKRSPGGGNLRTEKDGPIAGRPALCRRASVDERHRWQDSRPACVPGTMWGRRRCRTCKLRAAPCLPAKFGRPPLRRPPGCRALSQPEHELVSHRLLCDLPQVRPSHPAATPSGDARRRLCADSHRR